MDEIRNYRGSTPLASKFSRHRYLFSSRELPPQKPSRSFGKRHIPAVQDTHRTHSESVVRIKVHETVLDEYG